MSFRTLRSVSFLLAIGASAAYAGESACPSDPVHCAYFSGLSDSLRGGRYIKLENIHIGAIVVCFNGMSSVSILQEGAGKFLGDQSDTYFICTDGSGSNCEQVAVDNFDISKGQNGFDGKPQYFNIDMSAVKNKYPACGGALGKVLRESLPEL
jgi:hypothetical protein